MFVCFSSSFMIIRAARTEDHCKVIVIMMMVIMMIIIIAHKRV